MNVHTVKMLLAQATNAVDPQATKPDPRAQMIQTITLFAVMIFLFYFLLIRPQSKKAKEQAAMLKTVKSGDRVVTSSGIVGTVVAVKDKDGTVSLRSAETKLEVLKSSITDIKERGGEDASQAA